MASPALNPFVARTPPSDPTPEQLAAWLDDGRGVLRDAAATLRLESAIAEGRATGPQRRRLLGRLIDGAKAQLASLARWLAGGVSRGVATLGGWHARFAGVVAPHHYAAAMAATSPDLAPADRRAADGEVRKQLRFLARFRDQLRTGAQPLLAPAPDPETGERGASGRLVQRSLLYGDALWGTAEAVVREKMVRDGFTHERRVLGGLHHCRTCLGEAARGWSPVGSLRPIGESECRTNCRCHFTYTHADALAPASGPIAPPTPATAPTPPAPAPAPAPRAVPSSPRPLPRPGRPAAHPDDQSLRFSASDRSRRDKDRMVWVDVARLDAAWAADGSFYLAPGGSGPSGIRGRYAEFERFLADARRDGTPIEMSQVYVAADGSVSFVDGRHRFAVLRDAGLSRLPVAVDPEAAGRMAELYGASR